MLWFVTLASISLIGIVALGIYLELRPPARGVPLLRWWKGAVGMNLLLFVAAEIGLLLLGTHNVMAQEAAGTTPHEISIGLGLALLGIGMPTGLAAIGAGVAVGPVGAASLAIIAEKPEMFGRTLIYLGLAEGIAIYGLVVTILLLGKIA